MHLSYSRTSNDLYSKIIINTYRWNVQWKHKDNYERKIPGNEHCNWYNQMLLSPVAILVKQTECNYGNYDKFYNKWSRRHCYFRTVTPSQEKFNFYKTTSAALDQTAMLSVLCACAEMKLRITNSALKSFWDRVRLGGKIHSFRFSYI